MPDKESQEGIREEEKFVDDIFSRNLLDNIAHG
jgi:hypothetical protein